jgi:signal transduction histidine kinase
MYSINHYKDVNHLVGDEESVDRHFKDFCSQNALQAVLVARCDPERQATTAVWGFNVPVEPFNGAENGLLRDAISECFKIYPKAHIHNLGREGETLAGRARRHNRSLQEQFKMWFVPLRVGDECYVFLAFPEPGKAESLPDRAPADLGRILHSLSTFATAKALARRLAVTENFVKEIGHDLASSVQAILAKLRLVKDGRITGNAVKFKAGEIEEQIWDAYRIADSLGIAVESTYQLREPREFDLRAAARKVLSRYTSEAAERHVRFRVEAPEDPVMVWGDRPAIEQAFGQLISNAVKYSFGGNDIVVSISENRSERVVRVADRGLPLPNPPELAQIWDFGFRGRAAKEKHVNGSGIGLYSARKVVNAHWGRMYAKGHEELTEFFIHLPAPAAVKEDLVAETARRQRRDGS